ncbi:phage tail protein I [Mesorhizobium sp. B2-5-9]|uniref:phage tail protein I n=1 Tax=Mesorhizobium sp. B2-5-9 TaxID=2589921 RepID=UPI00112AFB97|nr:phage tail protein I [Mesorhizobium sp. B2-5-9]TPK15166.1 phage tail protein I [Mesorhizobium sp. B2-5-9]
MWWTATFEPIWTVSLLPGNSSGWEKVVEGVDGELVAGDPVGLVAASRSDTDAPLAWLPYLAAERSVDEFSGLWDEARQREVTRGSFRYHQVQGTRPALDRALTPLGYTIRVVEWFEAGIDRPYTFRVKVTIGTTDEWLSTDHGRIVRLVNRAKNAHTKLEAIDAHRSAGRAAIYVGGVPTRRRTLRVGQIPRPSTIRIAGYAFVGASSVLRRTIRVHPR